MKRLTLLVILKVSISLQVLYAYYKASPTFQFLNPIPDLKQIRLNSSSEILTHLPSIDFEVLYDLTYSPLVSFELEEYCAEQGLYYIQGYYSQSPSLQLSHRPEYEIQALGSIIKEFNMSSWAVVYSNEFVINYSRLISLSSVKIPISDALSPSQLLKHLSVLKYSQVTLVVVLLNARDTAFLLQTCNVNDYKGYVWLLSVYSDYLELNSSESSQNIIKLSATDTAYWADFVGWTLWDCDDYWECLRRFNLSSNRLSPSFYLFNVVDNQYSQIGACTPQCQIYKNIVWPTGLNSLNAKETVTISYDSSLYDPLGNYLGYLLPAYMGIELGIDYANNISSTLIINATQLNLGGQYYNKSYVNAELQNKISRLGAAMISPAISDVALNVFETFKNGSVDMPMIGYSNTVSEFSSSIDFPMYARVCMPDTYMAQIIALVIKYFGWTKVGVIYVNNVFSNSLYSGFHEAAKDQGIQILNEGVGPLAENSANWTNDDIDPFLKSLGESNARIIIGFCYTNEISQLLIRMHELGYYGPEYEYIAVGWLEDDLLNSNATDDLYKEIIRNSLLGSIMFFPVSFINEFGQNVQNLFTEKFKTQPVDYTSFAFDSVLAVYYAIENLISNNYDYENPVNFMKALRNLKFVGSTGTVSVQQYSNDRSPMDHFILNTKFSNNSWEIQRIGLFSPASTKVFTFYDTITWPGGVLPSDSPPIQNCPFPDNTIQYTIKGNLILILILASTISIPILAIKKGWKYWGKVENKLVAGKKYDMMFNDMLEVAKIAFEFFQYIGLIPSLPLILQIFKIVGNGLSLNLETIYAMNSTIYWRMYQIVLSFSGFIIIIRVLYFFKIKFPYSRLLFCLAGDLLWVGTLSTLLNIYQCQQSSILPFLYYDCYTVCWESTHTMYVIINSCVLVTYCYIIVLEKPKWNELESAEQHVFLSPKQTYIKSVFQATLVCLKKLIYVLGSEGYNIILLVLLTSYTLFIIKFPPYNVEIVSLACVLAYIGLVCAVLVSLISELTFTENSAVWLTVLLFSWAVILIFGSVYCKWKKYTWPFIENKYNITLFRFAFQSATIDQLKSSTQMPLEMTFRPYNLTP
jgi:ABC-type branched-subunit amino acid transport system substrate-binding protein